MSEYIFIGTCVKNPFERIELLVEFTEKAKKVSKENFLKCCGDGISEKVKMDMIKNPGKYKFARYYKKYEIGNFERITDIYWFHNLSKDIHYFFT